jgi:hypothetical protein
MAKRQPEKVYDRRSSDLPTNAIVSIAIVADPYSKIGEKLEVLRSIRDDPLAGMYSRSQIDSAQFEAGRKWQSCFEAAQIGTIQAIDPGKEAVDGGRFREPINDRQIKAFRALVEADEKLGLQGARLIKVVLADHKSISLAAMELNLRTQREIDYLGRRFRECLETLAILWGFASKA